MKRFLIMAAAMLAFMSCTKDIQEINQATDTEGTAFVAGQEVTIRCGNPQTKVSGTEKDNKDISFLWEDGDQIKVTVGGASSVFTLVSGAGTKTATFAGTMPASGTTFAIQYPETDPDLNTQTYSEGKLPAGKMKFTASDCTLDATANLTAAYAALRLNLYGLTPVGSIVVNTIESTAKTYYLDCKGSGSTGTEPGKTDTPKPFLIVVSAGTYGFTVQVKNVSNEQLYSKVTTTDKEFKANKVYSMAPLGYPGTDAQPLSIMTGSPATTTVWAPVNCGYNATDYPIGLLFQWGRKYGQNPTETITPTEMAKTDDTAANKEKFGKHNTSDFNWFSGGIDDTLWNGGTKGTNDPCPEGWRVPTAIEFTALLGSHTGGALQDGSGVHSGLKGKYFDGSTTDEPSSGVFFPAIGYRYYENGGLLGISTNGLYWSSSVDGINASYLDFYSNHTAMNTFYRSDGFPIRCVQE